MGPAVGARFDGRTQAAGEDGGAVEEARGFGVIEDLEDDALHERGHEGGDVLPGIAQGHVAAIGVGGQLVDSVGLELAVLRAGAGRERILLAHAEVGFAAALDGESGRRDELSLLHDFTSEKGKAGPFGSSLTGSDSLYE